MQIVLIDDVEANLLLLKHFIEQLGDSHEVTSFVDPQAALAHCERVQPDLVIVDYMMPVLDGIEFTRRLRAVPGRAALAFEAHRVADGHGQ